MKRYTFTLTVGIVCAMCTMAFGAVPGQITLQGILWDAGGNPVVDASYSVLFKIYDAPTGGNVLWSETQSASTTGGVYTVLLGSSTPIPDSTFNNSSRWLGMKVGADPEMSPRQQLASTGYSFVSSQWTSAGQNLFRLNGNVGVGTTNPTKKLEVAGSAKINDTLFASNVSSNSPLRLQTAGTNRMYIDDATGNIGIGTITPAQKLQIVGTVQTDGFKMFTGTPSGYMLTCDATGVGTWQAPPASGIGGSGTANNVAKFTSSTAIGNSAIFDNGNVGIGTTSPFAKLEVRSSGTPVAIVFGDNTGAGSVVPHLRFGQV